MRAVFCNFKAVFQTWRLFIFVNRNKNEPKNARPAKLPPVKQYRDTHPPHMIVQKLQCSPFDAFNLQKI